MRLITCLSYFCMCHKNGHTCRKNKRCTGHGETRLAQRRHLFGTLYRSCTSTSSYFYKKTMTLKGMRLTISLFYFCIFHKKDVRGTVRRASLKDVIWLGPLVGTLLCLMYINVVENDDAVYKKMMTLNDDVDLRTHEFDSAGRLFPPNMLVATVSASCTSTSSFLLFPPNMLVAPVPAFFDENRRIIEKIRDVRGTVRCASLKDAIWLGPSIAHVHQRRRKLTRK